MAYNINILHILLEVPRKRLYSTGRVIYGKKVKVDVLDKLRRQELGDIKMHKVVRMACQNYRRGNIHCARYFANVGKKLVLVKVFAQLVHVTARYLVAASSLCPNL